MGKLSNFSINLNSRQPVYYPGQTISGYVSLHLQQPMNMQNITIKLSGKGHTQWEERHHEGSGDNRRTVTHHEGSGDNRRTVTHHYRGNECILELVQNVFTGVTHPAGAYTYPFAFTLSQGMPSSFEGNHGYIRYILKAKIVKPWKFDHKVKCPISVNELIDANNPMYAAGVGGEQHKEVGCLCCKAGPLDVSANIDRSCYCPGEAILINAHAQNNTTRDMQNMHAKLIQTVTFHASLVHSPEPTVHGRHETRQTTKEIARLGGPPIIKGESATWQNQPFGIPATAPTITNSTLITVHYKLKVIVGVPWGMDPAIKMHITMGTVPYLKTYGHAVEYGTPQDQQAPPAANFIGGPAYPPPQPNLFGYPDMPPPSYSAVVGDTTVNIAGGKDEYTFGDMKYTPVYTFAQPYQGEYAPPPNVPPPQQQYPPQQYPPNPTAPPQ